MCFFNIRKDVNGATFSHLLFIISIGVLAIGIGTASSSYISDEHGNQNSEETSFNPNENHIKNLVSQLTMFIKEKINAMDQKYQAIEKKFEGLDGKLEDIKNVAIKKCAWLDLDASSNQSCFYELSNSKQKLIKNSEALYPLRKIPGTNLYTGVYYRVGMKNFPNGWVSSRTSRNTTNADENFLLIDINPVSLPHYLEGGRNQYINQWIFTETENQGWYTFKNRGIPNGFTTWSDTQRGSGYQLSISKNREKTAELSIGGRKRKDAMWKPVVTNQKNYYELKMSSFTLGVITWSYDKYDEYSHYIIAATKPEDMVHYHVNNQWYDDKLFRFDFPKLSLEATVVDFDFHEALDNILKSHNQVSKNSTYLDLSYSNVNSSTDRDFTLEEIITFENSYSVTFKQTFEKISKTLIMINIASNCAVITIKGGLKANQPQTTLNTQLVTVKAQIRVPKYSTSTASIYTERVENVNIPFSAKMEINGYIDRPIMNGDGRTSLGSVRGEIIKDHLMSSGLHNNIDTLAISDKGLVVKVTGILIGTFGIRTDIQCASCTVNTK